MSKRMNTIVEEFNAKSGEVKSTIENSRRLAISFFPEPVEVPKGHFDSNDTWKAEPSKYQYGGFGERNTMAEANNDRNADIDSKIAILDGKIANCDAKKGELGNIKKDCQDSLNNLNADIDILNNASTQFQSIATNMLDTFAGYNNIRNGTFNTYNCEPNELFNGTISQITKTNQGGLSNSITSGISTLNDWVKLGNDVMNQISNLESQLDEKISDLKGQRNSFAAMKH